MELVDTHCHIQSVEADSGEGQTLKTWQKATNLSLKAVLKNAHSAGIKRMICVGCNLADSQQAVNFALAHPSCWAAVGIHPHEARHYLNLAKPKLDEFKKLLSQPKTVAIGECGLDYYYQHSLPADQAQVLRFQIELAKEHNLPLIFHVRAAYDDFWPIFDQFSGLSGVLHSFTDSAANMQQALKRGLYIGVNGIATFTKDQAQLNVYKTIPIDKLVLETDAPFLTPTPYRGNINEPKNVGVIAKFLADLRCQSLEEIAAETTKNARRLFGF
ncbi:MAG TPA: TatD family hydrolase [Candidatus Dormibacteraeota bacterium]|nr:TatD family hydrolase [Candidatus Dormibacteraeota bacterium]